MIRDQPQTVFKRRHFGTPVSFTLITTNYIVVALGLSITTSHHHIHWLFWVIFGCLALYNTFSLRKNWAEIDRIGIIAYVIGTLGLGLLFLIF